MFNDTRGLASSDGAPAGRGLVSAVGGLILGEKAVPVVRPLCYHKGHAGHPSMTVESPSREGRHADRFRGDDAHYVTWFNAEDGCIIWSFRLFRG